MPINLQVVTAERIIFNDEVDIVVAPGTDGELGILPRHAPLLSGLKPGELRYRRGGEENFVAIGGGFIEVLNNKVIVLADSAERSEEIDLERAESARRTAEQALQNRGQLSAEQLAAAEASLRRALVRLDIGTRRRGSSRSSLSNRMDQN
ncbi:MAG: synthase epsilon subunit [Chloroflexi bacterium]|jgi:F-type H+-transporting ATPase subunit epsilon|nr:synthase epsilon subunit [Chloroflexota bacterium]